MHKLCFFVPDSHLEVVKNAVFDAGAGRFGQYERCCWQTPGQMQFQGSKNSKPFQGEPCALERVNEYKVEVICPDEQVEAAVAALRKAHPYEEPAFEAWPIRHFPPSGVES